MCTVRSGVNLPQVGPGSHAVPSSAPRGSPEQPEAAGASHLPKDFLGRRGRGTRGGGETAVVEITALRARGVSAELQA